MNTEELQSQAWKCCCDFHDDPEDIKNHLTRWEAQYGKLESGETITPPDGWEIIPYREVINGKHREFIVSGTWARWGMVRSGPSTMTPIFARPSRNVRAFARPA